MRLSLNKNLLFAEIEVEYKGFAAKIPRILVDTGSATTLLATDAVIQIGIAPEPEDTLYLIRGVGGCEAVFARRMDCFKLGDAAISDFIVEIGGMDYGFPINGIVGMDFLLQTEAMLDLRDCEIKFPPTKASLP